MQLTFNNSIFCCLPLEDQNCFQYLYLQAYIHSYNPRVALTQTRTVFVFGLFQSKALQDVLLKYYCAWTLNITKISWRKTTMHRIHSPHPNQWPCSQINWGRVEHFTARIYFSCTWKENTSIKTFPVVITSNQRCFKKKKVNFARNCIITGHGIIRKATIGNSSKQNCYCVHNT